MPDREYERMWCPVCEKWSRWSTSGVLNEGAWERSYWCLPCLRDKDRETRLLVTREIRENNTPPKDGSDAIQTR